MFADDTCLIGDATEIQSAENILEQTMRDWKEKVHPGKTEGLRLQQPPRALHDVRHKGEQDKVRHVGGILYMSMEGTMLTPEPRNRKHTLK